MSTRNKHITLGAVAIVVSWVLAVVSATWSASGQYQAVAMNVARNTATDADHEARLRVLENVTTQMASDVRWLREHLERQQR